MKTPMIEFIGKLQKGISNVFNVQIDPNLSRTFCDMKIRNNPTPWIDRAKEELLKRMQTWKRRKRATTE